ncbi:MULTISPECIES: stage V sporulation protein AA [Anaerostipes]|uniref:stage V sporulation protein AA n=1 Tax=Anaerostipes TaxID=207244 RepID=UPI0009520D5B|nr:MULTISPECIES: stage V sporulation protein AA [Anaerostipes]MCI5623699.1 stage V sporulation protein AA [Anaerostipes sp.]MDY2727111.1 stage V sporulation protein AA [Anaerostipes faecalis]OLR60211.1 hypothetical protein BHF70_11670 [Anaerostipes sp. 494a]
MTVYIKAEDSVCLNQPSVQLKDVISLYCSDNDLTYKMKHAKLYRFSSKGNQRKIFSVLKIVEVIKEVDKNAEIVNMGPEDFIVYFKQKRTEKTWMNKLKIAAVALTAFLGASFSIMSYNTDVGIDDLFFKVYQLVMGEPPQGPNLLHLSYTIGLAIGIIVFFNHAGKIKLSDDPTPFEVQMRLYERDVNDTLMMDADRKKEEEDVDS